METLDKVQLRTFQYGMTAEFPEYYPKYFESVPRIILGKSYNRNGIGGKLASVGPRKLIKKINYCILCIGKGF